MIHSKTQKRWKVGSCKRETAEDFKVQKRSASLDFSIIR